MIRTNGGDENSTIGKINFSKPNVILPDFDVDSCRQQRFNLAIAELFWIDLNYLSGSNFKPSGEKKQSKSNKDFQKRKIIGWCNVNQIVQNCYYNEFIVHWLIN